MTRPRALAGALAVLATIVALVTAVGIPARATYGARTSADEPQYLLTARSLGDDLDLDLADELAAADYRDFHEIDLDPQTFPLDDAGRQISPHDPLLPLVLALPMRLGGWVAAKATLAVLAGALAAATAWVAVRRFGVAPRLALPVVGIFAVSPPLATYATQVYPEVPAALCAVLAVAALTAPRVRRRELVVLGLALVALPWLSVKYLPVGAALGVVALPALRRAARRDAAVLAGALAVAALVYVVVHHRIWGGWTVYASGDHFVETGELSVVGTEADPWGRRRRLVGLLVDRGFGLIAWGPVWLFAPLAVGGLLHRRPRGMVALLVPVAAGWLTAAFVALTMQGWWWPGRQLVVVLPLLVIAVAWWLDQVRRVVPVFVVAAVLSVMTWVWTVVEATTRRRVLIVDFEQTANPWYRLWRNVLPDGRRFPPGTEALRIGWWLAVLGLVLLGALAVGARVPRGRARLALAAGALAVAIVGGSLAGSDDGARVRADQFADDDQVLPTTRSSRPARSSPRAQPLRPIPETG